MKFWFRRNKSLSVLRNRDYTFTVKRNKELPLEVWTYLVKQRAKFSCEVCNVDIHSAKLESHHIRKPEDGGKNILSNGKCLCTMHHGEAHTIRWGPRNRIKKVIFRALGKRWYRDILKEIKERKRKCPPNSSSKMQS